MQEFFSIYSRIENPTWEMIIFSFILSFLLSSLIAFTYQKTTQKAIKLHGLIQAFISSALIATMVLQAIGDNIASGLGMLGALNIIQFRTNLRNPRDAVFMFASLGAGIACGLYGFLIAILGASLFCILSFIIRYSPYHFSSTIGWNIKIRSDEFVRLSDDFQGVMDEYCFFWTMNSLLQEKEKLPDSSNNKYVYEYNIEFKNEDLQKDFLKALNYLQIQIVSLSKKSNK
jgi:uncharacterized membrane protein YhiD involved in acid resistance